MAVRPWAATPTLNVQSVGVPYSLLLLKQMILEGEIKDAKINSVSSDFQTLV